MKKMVMMMVLLAAIGIGAYAESYLGITIQAANLRKGPGTDNPVITTLENGAILFVYSENAANGFYKVIDIGTSTEGYVAESLVLLGPVVNDHGEDESPFSAYGTLSAVDPEITVRNDTAAILTLTMDNERYVFMPQEIKTLSLKPGSYSYMASAPGVVPYIGTANLEHFTGYSWIFTIETKSY